jgi:acyl carrier protein
MTTEEIIAQLNPIFKDVLDNNDITVNYNTIAADVEEWDSLTHIQLVVAIEKHFKIRFKSGEITGFKNVGEMCEAIKLKLASQG